MKIDKSLPVKSSRRSLMLQFLSSNSREPFYRLLIMPEITGLPITARPWSLLIPIQFKISFPT